MYVCMHVLVCVYACMYVYVCIDVCIYTHRFQPYKGLQEKKERERIRKMVKKKKIRIP